MRTCQDFVTARHSSLPQQSQSLEECHEFEGSLDEANLNYRMRLSQKASQAWWLPVCNPRTWEMEERESEGQGQPCLLVDLILEALFQNLTATATETRVDFVTIHFTHSRALQRNRRPWCKMKCVRTHSTEVRRHEGHWSCRYRQQWVLGTKL